MTSTASFPLASPFLPSTVAGPVPVDHGFGAGQGYNWRRLTADLAQVSKKAVTKEERKANYGAKRLSHLPEGGGLGEG